MKKGLRIYGIFAAALVFAAAASLCIGSARLSPAALWSGLTDPKGHQTERTILLALRLPRLLAALIAGVGLSVSGVLLQEVMGNPLASPNIIGVNAGAGLSVVLCLSLFPGAIALMPVSAFLGAFAAALLILLLARRTGSKKHTVVLAGVACTTLCQAGISFFSTLNTDVLSQYSDFSIGSFYGVRIDQLALPALLILLCFLAALYLSRPLTVLSLGDGIASSLGIRVHFLRATALLLASMSAAAVVTYAGLLGFVGLVVPHMARRILGESLPRRLTGSALLGALLVTLSDLVGRTVFAPSEIPVGIVMAFVGAPFFFWLLLRKGGTEHA